MFNQLSDQKNVLTSLQGLSAAELKVATDNITNLISSLNVDAQELLSNRKNHGALLGHNTSDLSTDDLTDSTLSELVTNEKLLTHVINTLCLTEAILVRDNFSNALEIIADTNMTHVHVTTKDIKKDIKTVKVTSNTVNAVNTNNEQRLTSVMPATKLPLSNIAPIHLVDVKQRLTQALNPSDNQHQSIKNKLNGLLVDTKSIHLVKQAI